MCICTFMYVCIYVCMYVCVCMSTLTSYALFHLTISSFSTRQSSSHSNWIVKQSLHVCMYVCMCMVYIY